MTIGEKIRYLRVRTGITQGKLAEKTGIHPVSIRKYETNKMQPQQPQIERIAEALNISATALLGVDHTNMRLETYGDLMGVIMVLYNSKIIVFEGDRDEFNLLKPETLQIKINPLLQWVLEVNVKKEKISLADISFMVTKEHILTDLLKWEKIHNNLFKYEDTSTLTKEEKVILADLIEAKEAIEIELQRSAIMLDCSDGIRVKMPTNFA